MTTIRFLDYTVILQQLPKVGPGTKANNVQHERETDFR